MPGSAAGTIISSVTSLGAVAAVAAAIMFSRTICGACAKAPVARTLAIAARIIDLIVSSCAGLFFLASIVWRLFSTGLRMVDLIGSHVGRRRHAVRHIEEGGDRRNVPDVAIGEAGLAQARAIVVLDRPRLGRELDG